MPQYNGIAIANIRAIIGEHYLTEDPMRETTRQDQQSERSDGRDLLQFQSALMREFYRRRAIRKARRTTRRIASERAQDRGGATPLRRDQR